MSRPAPFLVVLLLLLLLSSHCSHCVCGLTQPPPPSPTTSNPTLSLSTLKKFSNSKLSSLSLSGKLSSLPRKSLNILFSPYTANALAEVLQTLKSSPSTLAIRTALFSHPPITLLYSFIALSKLQQYVPFPTAPNASTASTSVVDETLLSPHSPLATDIIHYATYTASSYGWKSDLFSRFRLHFGDLAAVLRKTGLPRADIIAYDFEAKTHRPAYYLARDRQRKTIVLCVRGTLSTQDVLTDLGADEIQFENDPSDSVGDIRLSKLWGKTLWGNKPEKENVAHRGMVEAANLLNAETRPLIAAALAANSDYTLVITGHSLGAGCAAILGTQWRATFPTLKIFCYGAPCIAPLTAMPTANRDVVTVINEGDPFANLSLGHISDIFMAVDVLANDEVTRERILDISRKERENVTAADEEFLNSTAQMVRDMMTSHLHYPPGTIYYMEDLDGTISLRKVPNSAFGETVVRKNSLDLGPHLPAVYEMLLERYSRQP